MAQSSDSGATTYAALAIILLVAIAAIALYRFDLFDARTRMFGEDEKRDTIIRNRPDKPNNDGGTEIPELTPWSSTPPSDDQYRVTHASPLPDSLTITKKVGDHSVDVEVRLVPQGWFVMGEDDGVFANMPKRWVWMDDYYLATTETTNEQYYAFILDGGYRDSSYWTMEGYAFINQGTKARGSPYIGWTPLHGKGRIWALASPGKDLTLEVLDQHLLLGAPDVGVLVLPTGGAWGQYLDLDRTNSQVHFKVREDDDKWKTLPGEEIFKQEKIANSDYYYRTDRNGRIDLSSIKRNYRYEIVVYADGDDNPPTITALQRSESSDMRRPKIPVVGISWFEADACARFFGGALPTEAQWEKAGRGTDDRAYPWGEELGLVESRKINGVRRDTTSFANVNRWEVDLVAQYDKGKGPYGHHDLVGNVSEWCRDVYLLEPRWAEANPWIQGGSKEPRSQRGSSTRDDDPQTSKLYNRRSSDPYRRGAETRGFRMMFNVDEALKLAGHR